MPGATALAQARTAGVFTPTHEAFWVAARTARGDAAGTRALIEVLLHRHLPAAAVIAGIDAALQVRATSPVGADAARPAAGRAGRRGWMLLRRCCPLCVRWRASGET